MDAISVNNIPECEISRLSTGMAELDWIYDFSEIDDKKIWGLPVPATQLCFGEGGAGKTRLWTDVACKLNATGQTILVVQAELSEDIYKARYLSNKVQFTESLFFILSIADIDNQIDNILRLSPGFILIDSISMFPGMTSEKRVNSILDKYKKALKKVKSHIVFIGQIDKEGEERGSTALRHGVDIVTHLFRDKDLTDCVWLEVTGKNRFGRIGRRCILSHQPSMMKVESANRFRDSEWANAHGQQVKCGLLDANGNSIVEQMKAEEVGNIITPNDKGWKWGINKPTTDPVTWRFW